MAVNLGVALAIQVAGTAEADLKKIGASVGDVAGETSKASAAFSGATKQIAGMVAGFLSINAALGAIKSTVSTMSMVEDGMIGVAKTTGLAGAELENLKVELLSISRTTPTAAADLLKIAETAGQLGIQGSENIRKFTETIARLQIASDLGGEEGATILAQLMQITDEPIENIDRIASAIVKLGNESNATESKIARFAAETGRAVAQFGMSAVEVIGLSTAMAEVFNRPDEAASVFGRTLRVLSEAVRESGDKLEFLGTMTGMTGEQFAKLFAEDTMGAAVAFLHGLKASGGDATDALEALGLTGDEVNKTLPVLAENVDRVTINLAGATKEFDTNTAAIKESDAASKSFSAEVTRLKTEWALLVSQDATTGVFFSGIKWWLEQTNKLLGNVNEGLAEMDRRIARAASSRDKLEAANRQRAMDREKLAEFALAGDTPGAIAFQNTMKSREAEALITGQIQAFADTAEEAVEPANNLRGAIDHLEGASKRAKDEAREHAKALSEQERAAERAAREIERAAESVLELNERYRREVASRTEAGLLGLRDEDIAREVAALRAAGAAESDILATQQRLLEEYASKMEEFAERRKHALDYMKPKVDLGEIERGLASELPRVDFDAVENGLFQAPPQSFSDGVRQGIEDLKEFNSQVNLGRRATNMMAETLGGGFTDALMSIADGSRKAGDAFKDFGKRVVEALIQIAIQQAAVAAIGLLLAPFTGGASMFAAGAAGTALSAGGAGTSAGAMGFGSPSGGAPAVSLAGIQSAAATAPTREPSSTTININAVDAPSFQALLARDGQGVIKGVMSRASLQPSYGRG